MRSKRLRGALKKAPHEHASHWADDRRTATGPLAHGEAPDVCNRSHRLRSPLDAPDRLAPVLWRGRAAAEQRVVQGYLPHYAVAEIVTGYGHPESAIVLIVIAECALVVLYLVPQTSVLAAILMTGYLGGAVATHLRIADVVRAAIPLVVGILAWGGLLCGTAASATWFRSAGRRDVDQGAALLYGRARVCKEHGIAG